jgi:Tfp pilus assembly protein PilF
VSSDATPWDEGAQPSGASDQLSDEAYVRFSEGSRLLESGDVHAAIVSLERAREIEPEKGSIREALARAYFQTGRMRQAREEFEKVVDLDPVNDYAHFGLGLCLLRIGDKDSARGHLKIAVIMRPDNEAYEKALRRAVPDEPPGEEPPGPA